MQNAEYTARVDEVKRRAHGRWTDILASLGVDEAGLAVAGDEIHKNDRFNDRFRIFRSRMM